MEDNMKATYDSPELIEYGNVEEITRTGLTAGNDQQFSGSDEV
jgi:hypothetical protein